MLKYIYKRSRPFIFAVGYYKGVGAREYKGGGGVTSCRRRHQKRYRRNFHRAFSRVHTYNVFRVALVAVKAESIK